MLDYKNLLLNLVCIIMPVPYMVSCFVANQNVRKYNILSRNKLQFRAR